MESKRVREKEKERNNLASYGPLNVVVMAWSLREAYSILALGVFFTRLYRLQNCFLSGKAFVFILALLGLNNTLMDSNRPVDISSQISVFGSRPCHSKRFARKSRCQGHLCHAESNRVVGFQRQSFYRGQLRYRDQGC